MGTVEGWLAQGDYLTLCVELAARGLGFDAPSRRHPAPAASIQHSAFEEIEIVANAWHDCLAVCGVRSVHDDASPQRELGLRAQLRPAVQPFRLHDAAHDQDVVRGPVLEMLIAEF